MADPANATPTLLEGIQSRNSLVNSSEASNRVARESLIVCVIDPLFVDVNSEAFTPKYLIIGPYINKKSMLVYYERQKRIFLDAFMRLRGIASNLDGFCQRIQEQANAIYDCYESVNKRTWDFTSPKVQQFQRVTRGNFDSLIEMVLVDATFIIELFLRFYETGDRYDSVFLRDLALALNQLPMFILQDLYRHAFPRVDPAPAPATYLSFLKLTCHFFDPYYNQNIPIDDIIMSHPERVAQLERAQHFTDLLRMLQIPYPPRRTAITTTGTAISGEHLFSAVILRGKGVKIRTRESKCLQDIEFDKSTGKLRIPRLRVDGNTEPFFRNLIAWEQLKYPNDTYVTDYIFLMEYLMKSTEDVDLLVKKKNYHQPAR